MGLPGPIPEPIKFITPLKSYNVTLASSMGTSELADGLIYQAWLTTGQGLSQDLETGCPKLAIVKFMGVHIFKGDHNILRFQP